MKTITATIFSTPDQSQKVEVQIEGYTVNKWFGDRSYYFVNCEVLTPLSIIPSDLTTDLTVAIAEAIGEDPVDVRIECEVKVSYGKVLVNEDYDLEILFV